MWSKATVEQIDQDGVRDLVGFSEYHFPPTPGDDSLRAWVGVTDWDWYSFLSSQERFDEVNFWQPGGTRRFAALAPGEPFLFKLKYPRNVIVGGGLFARSTRLPLNQAWENFGTSNGALSRAEMKRLIDARRRDRSGASADNYTIGCILLAQPFFLPKHAWIPAPPDWHPSIVRGRIYDLTQEPGLSLALSIHQALEGANQEEEQTARLRDSLRGGLRG